MTCWRDKAEKLVREGYQPTKKVTIDGEHYVVFEKGGKAVLVKVPETVYNLYSVPEGGQKPEPKVNPEIQKTINKAVQEAEQKGTGFARVDTGDTYYWVRVDKTDSGYQVHELVVSRRGGGESGTPIATLRRERVYTITFDKKTGRSKTKVVRDESEAQVIDRARGIFSYAKGSDASKVLEQAIKSYEKQFEEKAKEELKKATEIGVAKNPDEEKAGLASPYFVKEQKTAKLEAIEPADKFSYWKRLGEEIKKEPWKILTLPGRLIADTIDWLYAKTHGYGLTEEERRAWEFIGSFWGWEAITRFVPKVFSTFARAKETVGAEAEMEEGIKLLGRTITRGRKAIRTVQVGRRTWEIQLLDEGKSIYVTVEPDGVIKYTNPTTKLYSELTESDFVNKIKIKELKELIKKVGEIRRSDDIVKAFIGRREIEAVTDIGTEVEAKEVFRMVRGSRRATTLVESVWQSEDPLALLQETKTVTQIAKSETFVPASLIFSAEKMKHIIDITKALGRFASMITLFEKQQRIEPTPRIITPKKQKLPEMPKIYVPAIEEPEIKLPVIPKLPTFVAIKPKVTQKPKPMKGTKPSITPSISPQQIITPKLPTTPKVEFPEIPAINISPRVPKIELPKISLKVPKPRNGIRLIKAKPRRRRGRKTRREPFSALWPSLPELMEGKKPLPVTRKNVLRYLSLWYIPGMESKRYKRRKRSK